MKSSSVSASCVKDWQKCEVIFNVDKRRLQLQQLEDAAMVPGFWDDPAAARKVIEQTNAQRLFVKPYDTLVQMTEEFQCSRRENLVLPFNRRSGDGHLWRR